MNASVRTEKSPSVRVAHVATVDVSLRYLLLNQLRRIQSAGYEVIGVSAPGEDVEFVEREGIRHIPVPLTRRFAPLQDFQALIALYRVMKRERFDVVHTHTPKPGLLGQLAARAAGVPVIVNTLHGFYFHDGSSRLSRLFHVTLERIAARCSTLVLSQNPEDIETAVRLGILRRDQIRFLGNGIDVTRFRRPNVTPERLAGLRAELGIPSDAKVVGFVGRLVAEKGLPELFEAMARVRERIPSVRLLVIGPSDESKPDALGPEAARAAGIHDLCVFAGLRQDMPELYSLMDVFALPSHREGWPRSPMEAAAMGVPCVATDIRGCRQTVFPDETGFLVPVRSPEALAAAILPILEDPALARRLGERAAEIAVERFDERQVHERVVAAYAELLGHGVRVDAVGAPLQPV